MELPDLDKTDAVGPLDRTGVKKLIHNFERKSLKNQELRIKFAGEPIKFMDAELELFSAIQEMHVISTQPEMYPILLEMNVIFSLMGLLSHENSDISCAAVRLLQELVDADDNDEYDELAPLLDALIESQVIAQLVVNIGRLNEAVKEESEGVHNSLAIIEILLDYKPELAKDCNSLITWLLQRVKAKLPFDGNKLYASEILSILIQSCEENRKLVGSCGGIDTLLQQVAYIKRHDATTVEEREYLENIFDCICSSLLLCPPNRRLFYDGEGIELMYLLMREKKKSVSPILRMGAVKVLNHLMSEDKGKDLVLQDCCNKFIEKLGLSVLFPIFLKPKAITYGQKRKELSVAIDDVEEHACSIILALLIHASSENKKRVLSKFVENDFEKTERIVELHLKYAERLSKCDALISKEKAIRAANDEVLEEDEIFDRRLSDGGLFTLQIVDQIILIISQYEDKESDANSTEQASSSSNAYTIKSKIQKLLKIRASSFINHYSFIRKVMQEMAEEQDAVEKERINHLIEGF